MLCESSLASWQEALHEIGLVYSHSTTSVLGTKASHFWRNLKNFHFWGGYIGKFFEFLNFFKSFHTNVAGNDPQWQIWPKSSLDWVKMAILHIFLSFPPKWGWDWLGIVNFTWFTTFPIFCHQSILFLEKSQKFSFLGGGYISNFFEFSNFFKLFHTNVAGNDPHWQIWPTKWLRLGFKCLQ